MKNLVSRVAAWARPRVLPSGRRGTVAGTALLAVVLAGSGTQIVIDRLTSLPDGAVLRAAGVTVSEQDYQRRVHLLGALYGVQAPPDGSKAGEFARATAKAIAVGLVLDHEAAAGGVVIAQKSAEDQLDKLVAESFPQGRDAFIQKLGQNGVSEADVLDEVKRQLANQQLYERVTAPVAAPTDAEVVQAYQERQAQLVQPEARHLRNIVIATREQADAAVDRLRGGADFAVLAAEISLDGQTKNAGGDLGTLAANQLQDAYAQAAFAAAPGAVFGPVQTQDGWNVGQVLDVQPPKQLTLDEVREPLKNTLVDERRLALWNSWLAERMKAADIRYADQYRPADPDTPGEGTAP
ncbi:peptidyl-prolyl cis-trans isomerase [Amycolatopsis methanolica]|uniref:peptidyl-prolyl cis-trans isomerase n=1 Tax=Amycolatopsis methanolica TaxID=1814 RepID=UPI00342CCBA7